MAITITVEKDGFYEVNGTRQEPNVSLYVIPAASKLRRMLKDSKELIVCPGVYDGLSARIAMELGFKAMYMVCARLPTIHNGSSKTHRADPARPVPELRRLGSAWPTSAWPSSTTCAPTRR